MISRQFRWVRRYFTFVAIGLAFAWSGLTILATRAVEARPGTIVLHIAHWQLENGVREAFDELSARYRQTHPNVLIVQDIVPSTVYPSWMSTNLIGGTAPDMMEIPKYKLPNDILVSYYNRYFISMSPYVNQVNPYNAGTELEKVPLRQCYKDGMRNAYIKEMQQYMHIPLSMFAIRIFYNKNLYKKLTGNDEPPKNYREFLAACRKIAEQTDERGQHYIPICNSTDSLFAWEGMMFDPITYGMLRKIDFNRDGLVTDDEMFAGFKRKLIDFQSPPMKARYKIQREVNEYFSVGYTGLTRDDQVFQFAQQRGVFTSTGTWDVRTLIAQAEGKFDVAIMDFPLPGEDDPEYGKVVLGPKYEEVEAGFPIAVSRQSAHPEAAVDFLLFLAGQKQNEDLNKVMGWLPVTQGAKLDPLLEKSFSPHLEGVYTTLEIALGSETRNKYQQLYSLYQTNEISYENMVKTYEPFYLEKGLLDFKERDREWRRGMQRNEQALAYMRVDAMTSAGPAAASKWIAYRNMTATQQVLAEIEHRRKVDAIEFTPTAHNIGPYEYSPEVLAKIKSRLAGPEKASSR